MYRTAALLLGLTLPLAAPVGIQAAESHAADQALRASQLEPASLERRLKSVGALIESSSAARQIKSNGSEDGRKQALELHRQAWEAYRAGDYAKANELLGMTTQTLFKATRQAHPEEVIAKKKQMDFSNRLKSTRALLDAQRRVSDEKSNREEAGHIAQVEKLLNQAETLSTTDLDRARALLDQAYLIAKASVGKMRQGDTLVRSLHFANKEEEYRYELDRFATHRMLVDMLTQEKQDNPTIAGKIRDYIASAERIKGQAEAKASGGSHGEAVELMEEATQELIRAIRAAGIFIPG